MSIEAINWALNLEHNNSTHKVILIGLSNHADPDGGSCYPSMVRLMKYTGLTKTTIIRAVKQMEELGIISAIHTKGKLTQYHLNIGTEPVSESDRYSSDTGITAIPELVTLTTQTGITAIPKPSITINEPSIYDQFEEFWYAYPRKVGKRKAEAEWKRAIKRATPDLILHSLQVHATAWASIEPKFIPHPTTWLTRDGWNDEPPTPQNKGHGSAVEAGLRLMEASE